MTKLHWTGQSRRRHKVDMLWLSSICACLACTAPVQAGEVSNVEVRANQIVLHFNDPIESASSFVLSGPDRIAIDIKGATARSNALNQSGLFRTVRMAQFDTETARVVLDLDRPAVVSAGTFSDDGRSLTLSVTELGSSQLQGVLAAPRQSFVPPAQFRAEPPKRRYSVRIPLPKASKGPPLPPVEGPNDRSRPLVVIDAGHGGHDPGAISPHDGTHESKVTLQIARAIRDELLKTGRFRVALTRDTDTFLVLQERYGIARRLGADLFISVHADAAASQTARGATIYTLSEVASDREAARLAARENKADILNGVNLSDAPSDVSSILIDLTQRETMNLSADFARLLRREGDAKMNFRTDSHRFASLMVLKAPDVPSVLLETGYVSNVDDVALLNTAAYRRKIAESVSQAVTVFFARKLASR
ncbi:N-acetylmuramoyl-L-alanine amidase [Sphingomonas sp. 35-24ZXX]|uniref:N-acetylmuramoyl-L-alanine amidase n=1 Tax=Sphingomonas sp. 35-24ZXX TaxID=1545915 RepID=UPI00053BF687|nr:N-acetylmuramoyl-L-alanine amidase [Sphingomonas sp. 35-24ZXX]